MTYNNLPIEEIINKITEINDMTEQHRLIYLVSKYNEANEINDEEEKKYIIHRYYFEYDEKYREEYEKNKIEYFCCLHCDKKFNLDLNIHCECGSNEPFKWADYDVNFKKEYLNNFVYYNQYGINQLTSQKIQKIFLSNDVVLTFEENRKYKEIFYLVFQHFKKKKKKKTLKVTIH